MHNAEKLSNLNKSKIKSRAEMERNMEQYTVTGMSCAACSAHVEKAVSKVPGVTSCSVSLLTNSMGVEGTALVQEITIIDRKSVV